MPGRLSAAWRALTGGEGGSPPVQASSSAYQGGGDGRRVKGFSYVDHGPTRSIALDGPALRARSRQLLRNDPHAKAAREVWVTTAIGEGVKPRPMHPDTARAKEARALWDLWVRECDAHGVDDFYGLQAQAAAAEFDGGEAFVRRRPRRDSDGLTVPLQLQLMESDQLPYRSLEAALAGKVPQGNRVEAGIELDALERRVAYHFYLAHPRDGESLWAFNRVETRRTPAGEVLHVFRPERPGQLRGAPQLAPVIDDLIQKHAYFQSEVERAGIAAKVVAAITESARPDDSPYQPPIGANAETTSTGAANPQTDGTVEVDLTGGEIPVLQEGQDIKFNNPSIPGGAFEAYMRSIVHAIAAGARVPYTHISADLSDVNFSSMRGGQRQFAREIGAVQRRHQVQFWNRVWAWFIDAAFLSGALTDRRYPANREDWLRVKWTAPRGELVDPAKEIGAHLDSIEGKLVSRRTVQEQLGYDPDDEDRLIAEDKMQASAEPRRRGKAQQPQPPPDEDDDVAGATVQ